VGKITNVNPLISNITQDIIIEPQFDEKNRAWSVIIHCEGEDKNFGICPAGKTL
jgi:hypothetical protein